MFSLGAWMFASGSENPEMIARDPLIGKRSHDRQRATGADQGRAHAEHALERVLAELDRAGIRRDDSRDEPMTCAAPRAGRRRARRS